MKKLRCSLLLGLFISLSEHSVAQTYHFDNYGVKEGLSQSTIYSLTQDGDGNLWLGSRSGISRFDGINFSNFSTNEGISGNGARSSFMDNSGNIWFGHLGGGITRFSNGAFSVIELKEFKVSGDVTSITQDEKGRIWFSTIGNGVFRINNPGFGKGEAIKVDQFLGKHGLSDRIFEISSVNGQLYFVTDAGIKRLIKGKESFESFAPENLSTFFQITTLFEDSKGNIWYGTYNGGLYRQGKNSGDFRIYDMRDGLAYNWISCISEDAEGRIWAGTWGGGISVVDGKTMLTFNEKNGLPDLKIFDIMKDREGNMIIGSNENGLYIFKGEHFTAYTEHNGLSNDQVWAVLKDKYGKIWFGTSAGITVIQEKNGIKEYTYLSEASNNFFSDDIRFLDMDKNGDVWVGSIGGVIKIDPSKPKGPYFFPARLNAGIRFQVVTAMDIDKFNNLWVGTIDGLLYYEIDNNTMSYLTTINGLAGNEITEVFCDQDGVAWVGSKGTGLTKIMDTTFTIMDLGGEITPNVIREDRERNLWVGTDGQGLFISKDKKSITENFTTEDGILANLIIQLEVDFDNNLWIGTNKGLNKLERKTNNFIAYTEQDGFTGIECKPHASLYDTEGILWFGTVRGAIVYDVAKDKTNELLPIVRINNLKVNLENRLIKDGEEFTYKEKSFYFDFKGIYLTNPKSVVYKYMLEGIDADWSPPTNLTFASYPALPEGRYTFKVMASNNTGKWSEVPAIYHFRITPPFWKTWWFYLFCVVFIASWIIYLIRLREESLKKEKKILEDKVAERTKELAEKNKDITASIRYAERIQRAILPPDEEVRRILSDSFIFYRPKDIVSGDFYWVSSYEGKALFSAVDCTGHGVPGAFMSIVGHNLLDKIVKEEKITTPSKILDSLNVSVSLTLRQKSDNNEVKDGMDLSLVSLDREGMTLEYAGAHNPIYIIRGGELIETKADKFAIGSFIRGEKSKFINHHFDLLKGDVIYVFSDGFPDQFGGPAGKKYKYKPFKNFLLSICSKPMQEQRKALEEEFISWLGTYGQIDDVIIIGVRI